MGKYEDRKKAKNILKDIENNPKDYKIIHYSCDNFINSSTVTSISIQNLFYNEIETFSLYNSAKNKGIAPEKIPDNIQMLEQNMLTECFQVLSHNPDIKWIHWNMSSTKYGFKALECRYRELCGDKPYIVADDHKINLSHLFVDLFDEDYAGHPRMEKLMKLNAIPKPPDFFPGLSENETDEVDLFNEKRYQEIEFSCARKVDLFSKFLDRAINNRLKVKTPWYSVYGCSIKGIWEAFVDKHKFISYMLVAVAGFSLERLFNLIIDFFSKLFH